MKRRQQKRPLPRPFKMPWAKGEITEEASFKGEWHEPAIQLMKYEDGTRAVRFAHYSKGSFQRSPLIVGVKDFGKLKKSIDKNPELKRALKLLVTE